ncbi:hypothetical protein L1049_013594 [Liquidambar formosana]|uniref:Uncharacterized protein n=1 Tax=Liquidambar formosana TaxID=63359 RepID=A0AAP0WYM2_LIQFO
MAKDEWIRAAMTDDSVVVELLLRLKQSYAAPPSKDTAVLPPLRWGLRQPRSRPALRCDAVSFRKEGEPTRVSPTTPLSWSGGASPSAATADGFEASSRPTSRSPVGRSKGAATNDTAAAISRRSRRKKTFAELKDEESSLLKERIHLKRVLATLRTTFKEQRARNESLKRMKLDFDSQFAKKTSTTSDELEDAYSNQPRQVEPSTRDYAPSMLPTHATCDEVPQSDSCKVRNEEATQERNVTLPDLNMMPSEDDSGFETLYGTS